jgi:hypothetical protein
MALETKVVVVDPRITRKFDAVQGEIAQITGTAVRVLKGDGNRIAIVCNAMIASSNLVIVGPMGVTDITILCVLGPGQQTVILKAEDYGWLVQGEIWAREVTGSTAFCAFTPIRITDPVTPL